MERLSPVARCRAALIEVKPVNGNSEEARRLTQLEKENARLKKLLAEAELEKAMLKDLVAP